MTDSPNDDDPFEIEPDAVFRVTPGVAMGIGQAVEVSTAMPVSAKLASRSTASRSTAGDSPPEYTVIPAQDTASALKHRYFLIDFIRSEDPDEAYEVQLYDPEGREYRNVSENVAHLVLRLMKEIRDRMSDQ